MFLQVQLKLTKGTKALAQVRKGRGERGGRCGEGDRETKIARSGKDDECGTGAGAAHAAVSGEAFTLR